MLRHLALHEHLWTFGVHIRYLRRHCTLEVVIVLFDSDFHLFVGQVSHFFNLLAFWSLIDIAENEHILSNLLISLFLIFVRVKSLYLNRWKHVAGLFIIGID